MCLTSKCLEWIRAQWEMFLHVVEDAPWQYDLMAGARGVQLAELGMQSWAERRSRCSRTGELKCQRFNCQVPMAWNPIDLVLLWLPSLRYHWIESPCCCPCGCGSIECFWSQEVAVDWDATLGYRRYLWSHGGSGRSNGHCTTRHGIELVSGAGVDTKSVSEASRSGSWFFQVEPTTWLKRDFKPRKLTAYLEQLMRFSRLVVG